MDLEEYSCVNGGKVKIEKIISGKKALVSFSGDKSGNTYERDPYKVRKGKVKNKFQPSVYGVGYVGEGGFCVGSDSYGIWRGIIKRCYSSKTSSYALYGGSGVSVSDDWLNYQNFASWFEKNKLSESCNYNVDKDLIGRMEYSEDSCVLIPCTINKIINKQKSRRSDLPIGVFHSSSKKNPYSAMISVNGKAKNLGVFRTIREAFLSYKTEKESLVKIESEKAYKLGFISIETKEILDNFKVNYDD